MTTPARPSLTRLALGAVVLASERLGVAERTRAGLATATGLAARAATGAREAVELAHGAVDLITLSGAAAAERARAVPAAALRPVVRGRAVLRDGMADARRLGTDTLDAGRAEALAFVRSNVDDGVAWAQANVVPQIVDGLVPHLVDEVVPRIIEGVLPEIRTRVLPVVIGDLATDPRVRDLVVEQGRGVLGDVAEQVRTGTATADDQVEAAVRRIFGGGRE
ncbi:MAG TPA: hypothetical protein VGJ63_03995 [Micromonosporaceae bacterium]|jgi:hypothetical protein